MCGFCSEGTPIELAKALTAGVHWPPELERMRLFNLFYLQESSDIFSALLRSEPQLNQIILEVQPKEDDTFKWEKDAYLCVAFCRIIETLIKHGFQSDEYQRLVKASLVTNLVRSWEKLRPTSDEQWFTSPSLSKNLFHEEFFFNEAFHNQIMEHPNLEAESQSLLEGYVEWWYSEEELWKQSEVDGFRTQYEIFQKFYPCVFFSYLIIERTCPEHKAIGQIVKQMPTGAGATFEGLDFWLQRKAALTLYDVAGIENFWPFAAKVRSPLTYYLLVKNKLDPAAKQTLQKAILQADDYKPDTDWSREKKRRLIYMAPSFFIMDYLQSESKA